MPEPKLFHDVLRERHSVRSFLPDEVPDEVLRAVLEDAQLAPSNCNTQPWQVHIVSGAKRDELSRAILADDDAGHNTPDFSFALSDFKNEIWHQQQPDRRTGSKSRQVAGKGVAPINTAERRPECARIVEVEQQGSLDSCAQR